jgi:hypothetical protein
MEAQVRFVPLNTQRLASWEHPDGQQTCANAGAVKPSVAIATIIGRYFMVAPFVVGRYLSAILYRRGGNTVPLID